MSFDLAVWEGPRPSSDAEAVEVYERLSERMESEEAARAPSPRIRAYVDALLARWPDITEDDTGSPWASGPLIGDAWGDAIYLAIVWSRADEAAEFVARVADEHGLICFDPQSERLVPRAAGSGGTWVERVRRWFA